MSRPISIGLLIHSVTYEKYKGTVASKRTYDTALTVVRVRMEPVKRNTSGNLGEGKDDRFTMFYDSVLSCPKGLTFVPQDRVTFLGETLVVREAKPCFASGSGIHHWEVFLG